MLLYYTVHVYTMIFIIFIIFNEYLKISYTNIGKKHELLCVLYFNKLKVIQF